MKLQPTARSIAALAALCAGTPAVAADPSRWTCELCPPEAAAGVSGQVDLGVGQRVDAAGGYRDFNGLGRNATHRVLGGGLQARGADGWYGSLAGQDLGLDARTLAGEVGREGQFRLRMGYTEIPRHLLDGASTPFLGVGGNNLTLPAGYPALGTGAMPLASTLQPVDVDSQRKRLDAALTWDFGAAFSTRLQARHDVKDGLQRTAGSFFSTTSQLLAPVDQTIDSVEATAAYMQGPLHASVGYYGSWFRNGNSALSWSNPFLSGNPAAQRGQLALAPDNEFNQVSASLGYDHGRLLRVSGDVAWGQMTQDAALLATSLNPALAATLPAATLAGRVNTFNANGRVSAQLNDELRVTATWARDVHDNRTRSLAWPAVTTDLQMGTAAVANQPFSFTRDLFKVGAEYRGPGTLRAQAGGDYDRRDRTLQEVASTQEVTGWVRVSARPLDTLSLSMKLLHGRREPDAYGSASWISPPENPLMRKFNMATRVRDAARGQLDATLGDTVNLSLSLDYARDRYRESAIGLTASESLSAGADLSVALTDDTQLHAYLQGERIDSDQAGSHLGTAPLWTAQGVDRVQVAGLGLRHKALKGRLELGLDLTLTRSGSDLRVDTGVLDPGFPTARTSLDALRLSASWQLQQNLALVGSYWYEFSRSNDWHLDGVTASTVPVLLALGDPSPRYRLNLLRVALRYRF